MTVHAHPKNFTSTAELWPEMVDTFRSLGDDAGEARVSIGIETMFPPSVQEFVRLIHDIGHPFVGATVDTGHVTWSAPSPLRGTAQATSMYNANLEDMVNRLSSRLRHCHVHDVRLADWRDHREVGIEGGSANWARFIAALTRVGFSGMLAFEIEEEDRINALRRRRDRIARLVGQ